MVRNSACPSPTNSRRFPCVSQPHFLPQALAASDLSSVTLVLPFAEGHVNESAERAALESGFLHQCPAPGDAHVAQSGVPPSASPCGCPTGWWGAVSTSPHRRITCGFGSCTLTVYETLLESHGRSAPCASQPPCGLAGFQADGSGGRGPPRGPFACRPKVPALRLAAL